MEKIGEKHAFFEKRKCGSRKVLRFMRSLLYALTVLSLPLRGAWIEIAINATHQGTEDRRSPCGERGLKFMIFILYALLMMSLPLRGAWIEMWSPPIDHRCVVVAPPAGSVD